MNSRFKVDDTVRILKLKHVFSKGYTVNQTEELLKIVTVKNTTPISYILKNENGNIIRGGFYDFELLKIQYDNIDLRKY